MELSLLLSARLHSAFYQDLSLSKWHKFCQRHTKTNYCQHRSIRDKFGMDVVKTLLVLFSQKVVTFQRQIVNFQQKIDSPFKWLSGRFLNFRFRSCLRMVNSARADMVGRFFFDIIRIPCFVFSEVKKCTSWTWWGRCRQEEMSRQAVLRPPMSYWNWIFYTQNFYYFALGNKRPFVFLRTRTF